MTAKPMSDYLILDSNQVVAYNNRGSWMVREKIGFSGVGASNEHLLSATGDFVLVEVLIENPTQVDPVKATAEPWRLTGLRLHKVPDLRPLAGGNIFDGISGTPTLNARQKAIVRDYLDEEIPPYMKQGPGAKQVMSELAQDVIIPVKWHERAK